ncbi:hypothetical protein HHI36_008694, partial [Cryptolaemus montrouzieri]
YRSRKTLNSVAQGVALYAAIWVSALKVERNKNILLAAQKKTLTKIVSAYRTVSAEAVQAIAGVPPINLQAKERNYTSR